jgi:uncharacterized protein (DUF952 family)
MTLYQTAKDAREAGIAYHMAPEPVWTSQKDGGIYLPEPFDQDGFIHTTNGLERLLWVANEFYTGETRPLTVLVLDVSKVESPVRYDDEAQEFPHIYGRLNTDAVIGELRVERDASGQFLGFFEPDIETRN